MESYDNLLPGTANTPIEQSERGFAKIEVLLEATGGLSLSQVCVVTGLEASTIQNWVKRGWVAHPIGKRYEEIHIARILIINALKECIKLEHIAKLMIYLNGKSKDGSQAIIRESTLYDYLCEAMKRSGQMGDSSKGGVESVVDTVIKDYKGPNPEARTKLRKALTLMMFACVCSDVKRRTEAMMGQIVKEVDEQSLSSTTASRREKPAASPAKTPATPAPAASRITPAAPVIPAPPAPPASPVTTPPAATAPITPAPASVPVTPPAPAPASVKPIITPQPVTPIKITLDDPVEPESVKDEISQTRKTISQALREWDISSVEKIIIDHDEEARNNVKAQEEEIKKPVNRPWYIRKSK